MSSQVIRVTTPSRLHFGLFSFGYEAAEEVNRSPRQFGGVGAMIAGPGITVKLKAAERLEVAGPLADRAARFARLATAALGVVGEPACRIEIASAPREHVGLGTGTQLALAVAAAMHAFFGRPPPLPADLARTVGRGQRSAIGTHGFAAGGLLVEAGKRTVGEVSPLVARAELPGEWRFVLLIPRTTAGLSSDDEREAFFRLPPVPREVTKALAAEALLHLLPAAVEADFGEFSRSLYHYGQLAGNCFAAQQHGAYHNPHTAELAAQLRELGVEGVGQSSWGPTLFALLPDEPSAQDAAARLQARTDLSDYECQIVAPNNHGARLDVEVLA